MPVLIYAVAVVVIVSFVELLNKRAVVITSAKEVMF